MSVTVYVYDIQLCPLFYVSRVGERSTLSYLLCIMETNTEYHFLLWKKSHWINWIVEACCMSAAENFITDPSILLSYDCLLLSTGENHDRLLNSYPVKSLFKFIIIQKHSLAWTEVEYKPSDDKSNNKGI